MPQLHSPYNFSSSYTPEHVNKTSCYFLIIDMWLNTPGLYSNVPFIQGKYNTNPKPNIYAVVSISVSNTYNFYDHIMTVFELYS